MIPATLNLKLYRGDYSQWRVRLWKDKARMEPYDLTDYTVASHIRVKAGDTGKNFVKLNCEVTLPNIIDISIDETHWGFVPTKGAWDVEIIDPNGHPHTPAGGTVNVVQDVTFISHDLNLDSLSPEIFESSLDQVLITITGTGFTNRTHIIHDGIDVGIHNNSEGEILFYAPNPSDIGEHMVAVEDEGVRSNFLVYGIIPKPPVLDSIEPPTIVQNSGVAMRVHGSGFNMMTQLYQNDELYGRTQWVSETEFGFNSMDSHILGVKTLRVENANGVSNELSYEVIP